MLEILKREVRGLYNLNVKQIYDQPFNHSCFCQILFLVTFLLLKKAIRRHVFNLLDIIHQEFSLHLSPSRFQNILQM
uniref:ELMO/CED-12 family protein n=1 Tax=Rhizophora mucronata TaxID=61149 RepID=A0A2P2JN89_RHIMU